MHFYDGRPIRQAIIFSSYGFFFLSFFFPRLFSAVADWMSTILSHMVWLQCKFRMHIWNVLHTARWIYRTQKIGQKIAIGTTSHNFVGLYLRNWGMYRQSEKYLLNNNISSTYPHNMVNFGPLAAKIDWRVWGTQQISTVSRLGFVTAGTSLNGSQPNIARCLAVC